MSRHQGNEQRLSIVLERLGPMGNEMILVGGTAAGFLITDPAAAEVRETLDVDLVSDIVSWIDYAEAETALRKLGFRHDMDGPRCRFNLPQENSEPIIVDFMTTEEDVLKFTNKWYKDAFKTAVPMALQAGQTVRVITAPYFLATKIEAFFDRGKGDFIGSKDMSDVILVLDGRPQLLQEIRMADTDLRTWLAEKFSQLLNDPNFEDSIEGLLRPGPTSLARRDMVLETIERLVQM